MKKAALVVAVSVFTILMVLPVARSVNLSAGKPVTIDRTMYADGWPIPLKAKLSSTDANELVADGAPRPVPLPPNPTSVTASTLMADGAPRPVPLPPNPLLSRILV